MSALAPLRNPWFGQASLTGAVEKTTFVPGYLGGLGIFQPEPVNTYDIFVDRRDQVLTLVPSSELGAPPDTITRDSRDVVALRCVRLAQDFLLRAYEVQGIRGFNTETEFENLQAEYLARFNKMRRRLELTREHHRLGAVQGLLLDSDGTTVLEDYYTKFGVTKPAAIDLNLSDATLNVNKACKDIARSVVQGSRGAITPGSQLHILAGNELYDALVSHPNVEKFYLNQSAASEARRDQGVIYESFSFGGFVWHNYRGTDDNTAISIPDNEGRLFPVGAPETFKKAMGPPEMGQGINSPGQDFYAYNLIDPTGRDAYTTGELYAYPLYFNQRPDLLRDINKT